MKVVSINIELSKHLDRVFAFIAQENPDVLCLQELLEEDFAKFKEQTGLAGVFQASGYVRHPDYADCKTKKEGVGIFARDIVSSGHAFYVGKAENLSLPIDTYLASEDKAMNKALIWAEVRHEDTLYKFVNVQLPVTEQGSVTPFQMQVIDNLLAKLDTMGDFILCGDTNAPRGRESFARFTAKYTDNIPAQYMTSLDQNLHRVKGLIYMVDGLFTTNRYRASDVRLVDGVSDHMAVVGMITYKI